MDKHYKSKIAAIAVGTAIKVLTGVVCGAVVLTGTYGVVKHTVLPNSTAKTQSMFAYEGEAGTGGTGGSIGDNPIYQTELKRNGVIPAGGVYTLANGTQLTEGDSFPDTLTEGDTYKEGDYIYTYGLGAYGSSIGDSWAVMVLDYNKTEYGQIIAEIAGKPLTSMIETFSLCSSLTTAPAIPNSVTDMYATFQNCSSLTDLSHFKIPSGVLFVECIFDRCSSLTTAPTIPNGVIGMNDAFSGCTSLTTVPTIPDSVTDMTGTFSGCTSLTDAPTISSSVTTMDRTFYGCTSLTTAPTIPSSVTNMQDTFNGCTSLTTAPVIPSSVTSMYGTFNGCTSLAGTIEVNANPTSYTRCLKSTQITGITGSCSQATKDALMATK